MAANGDILLCQTPSDLMRSHILYLFAPDQASPINLNISDVKNFIFLPKGEIRLFTSKQIIEGILPRTLAYEKKVEEEKNARSLFNLRDYMQTDNLSKMVLEYIPELNELNYEAPSVLSEPMQARMNQFYLELNSQIVQKQKEIDVLKGSSRNVDKLKKARLALQLLQVDMDKFFELTSAIKNSDSIDECLLVVVKSRQIAAPARSLVSLFKKADKMLSLLMEIERDLQIFVINAACRGFLFDISEI
jgi:hypothetical protein